MRAHSNAANIFSHDSLVFPAKRISEVEWSVSCGLIVILKDTNKIILMEPQRRIALLIH